MAADRRSSASSSNNDAEREEQDDDIQSIRDEFRLLKKKFDEKEAQVDELTKKLDSLTAWKKQVSLSASVVAGTKHYHTSTARFLDRIDSIDMDDSLSEGDIDVDEVMSRSIRHQPSVTVVPQLRNTAPGGVRTSVSYFKSNRRSHIRTSTAGCTGMERITTMEQPRSKRGDEYSNEFEDDYDVDIDFECASNETIDLDTIMDKQKEQSLRKRSSRGGVDSVSVSSIKGGTEVETSVIVPKKLQSRYVLPEDVFTMMFFSDHECTSSFLYGMFVFALQMLTLAILLSDLTDDDGLPEGEVDRNRLNLPIQVNWQVHTARIIAVLVTVISRDDCLDTFWIVSIGFKSRWQHKFPGATVQHFILMNILRFAEGAFCIIISFIVVVQSDNVIDLFLNFAAIEFVSNLDNISYHLAASGWLTRSMLDLTERIDETIILLKDSDREKLRRKQFLKHVLMVVMLVALYSGLYAIYRIEQNGTLLKDVSCERVLVTLGEQKFRFSRVPDSRFKGFELATQEIENTEQTYQTLLGSERPILSSFHANKPPDLLFSHFSGVYEGLFDSDSRIADRPVYYERGFQDPSSGKFYYCLADKAWVFTIEAFGSHDAVPEATQKRCKGDGWLLRSPVTDAYSLEDAPLDGWKVWTGSFLEVEGFDVKCATCSTDIDCSVNRGTCNFDGRCICEDGFDGQFCEADIPCDYVVNYSEGRAKVLEKSDYLSNKRPIYLLDLDGDEDEEDRKLDERGDDDDNEGGNVQWEVSRQNSFRMLVYAGTRWYDLNFAKTDLQVFQAFGSGEAGMTNDKMLYRFSKWFHPYWAGIQISGTQHLSEPTDQIVPTGPLAWQSFLESRAEGSYGIYGAVKDNVQSFECLSVDCSVENICGKFGDCMEVDNIVVFGGTVETNQAGNQCVCSIPRATGHYCEFYNYVKWDENGTITNGPYELDPFQAGCYGPLRNLTDCVEKLYPDFEQEDS